MSFVWTIKPVQGLWVGEASFDKPGEWEARIDVTGGGYDASVRTMFEVKKEGTTPEIGEKAPRVDTPTISDVSDLLEITTDSDPARRCTRSTTQSTLMTMRPETPSDCLARA